MRAWTTLLLLGLANPLAAQERQPQVSEEDFVCQLAGECTGTAAKPTTSGTSDDGRVSESRGFSISRPDPARASSNKAQITPARNAARTTSTPNRFGAPVRKRTPNVTAASAAAAPVPSYAEAAPVPPEGRRKANLFVTFRLGSDELTPEGAAQARVFARALQLPALADKRFAIVGHTDTVGSAQSNVELSQRRAASVQRFLVANGVPTARLDVVGRGPNDLLPERPGTDPANRRVEAEVLN